jgi:excisionase family DNA binding protein
LYKLWQHPSGRWYVLYGRKLEKRKAAKTADKDAAEAFLSRFIAQEDGPLALIGQKSVLRDRNTVAMVADFWGISSTTVSRMIKDGSLACLRLGGVVRITREQVEACEAACLTAATVPEINAFEYSKNLAVERALTTARRQKFGK